jgi:hypothetical protein
MVPVEPRPGQRRGASVGIDHQVVHRPALPLFPDPRRKMVTDDGCAGPFGACRRTVDGLRAEACGNRVSPIEAAAEPDQGETCGMGGVSWPDISFAVEGELFA